MSRLRDAVAVLTGRAKAARGDAPSAAPVSGLYTDWERNRGIAADTYVASDTSRMATSDDVYAAVTIIANAAKTVPLLAMIDEEPQPDSDLQALLDHPNAVQSQRALKARVLTSLLLTGECFLWVVRSNPYDSAMPNELWWLPSDRIRVVPGQRNVAEYRYTPAGKSDQDAIPIPPEDGVWVTLPHPDDPLRGLSPIASLRLGLDSERQSNLANRDLFANGAMIDGALSVEGPLSETQREHSKAALRDRHVGAGKRHQILFLEAGKATFTPMRLTPRDAEFLALGVATTRDVAKVLQVPPMYLADLERATYSNFEQAETFFWTLGVLPRVDDVADALTMQLAWQFGDGLSVEKDDSDIEALREDQLQQANTAKAWVDAGYDPGFVFEFVTGEPLPAGGVAPQPPPPTVVAPPPGTPPMPAPPMPKPAGKAFGVVTGRTKATARGRRYDRIAGARESMAPYAVRSVTEGLLAQRDIVIERAARIMGRKGWEDELLTLLNLADPTATLPLELGLVDVLTEAGQLGAETAGTVFGLDVGLGRVLPQVQAWAESTAAEMVTHVNADTIAAMRVNLATALREQQGFDGVKAAIERSFALSTNPAAEFTYSGRVDNIAQTEMSRGFGFGNHQAMQAAGIMWHEWMYSGITPSRHGPGRSMGEGQIVPINKDFSINGYAAKHPSDARLPASESCRCKCVVVPAEAPAET